MTLPPSMKEFNITATGVKIDVAAIEWPANATALVYEDNYPSALVCRTTDPDESKKGAETSEIRIRCRTGQVIGTLGLRRWRNDIIRRHMWTNDLFLRLGSAALASSFLTLSSFLSLPSHPQGAVDKIVLPEGMQTVNFSFCKGITGTAES